MLDNGVDSLNKGFFDYLMFSKTKTEKKRLEEEDYFVLKQAILSVHHGVEILLKCILNKTSEFLIIEEIDKTYKAAYREKIEKNYSSIFETSKASKIHTITFEEALSRVECFCPELLPEELKNKLRSLNTIRNALSHAEVSIDDNNIEIIFNGLLVSLDVLFSKAIGVDYRSFYGYSEIKANYDKYMQYFNDHKMEIKKKAIDILIKAQEKIERYTSKNGILYIDNIILAKKFLECVQEEFCFGMDIYNRYCSGKTYIKITDDKHMKIWAKDNYAEYIIKFKSMIIIVPDIKSNLSPVLILESDDDIVEDKYRSYVSTNQHEKILEGICINNNYEDIIYEPHEISDFFKNIQLNESDDIPVFHKITRFLDKRIFACLNLNNLDYGDFHRILKATENLTGLELFNFLDKDLNDIQSKLR